MSQGSPTGPVARTAHRPALDDFSAGVRVLDSLTRPRGVDGKAVKGINFFEPGDSALLRALQNPRINIAGIRRAPASHPGNVLAQSAVTTTTPAVDIGAIKRVTGTYRDTT